MSQIHLRVAVPVRDVRKSLRLACNLRLERGKWLGIIGLSAGGKTALLQCLP